MPNLKYIVATAILGGMIVLPQTGSAGPLASGLGAAGSTLPVIANGLVQKVHGWHCARRKGWYKGAKVWHRHRRACYDDSYEDDYDDDYRTYRPSPNVYIRPTPHIDLYIGSPGDWD